MLPAMGTPELDPRAWVEGLVRLLTDRAHYCDLSARSRAAALQYAHSVTVEPFEAYLKDRVRAPRRFRAPALTRPAPVHPANSLSPHRRRLLVTRLKQRDRTDQQ